MSEKWTRTDKAEIRNNKSSGSGLVCKTGTVLGHRNGEQTTKDYSNESGEQPSTDLFDLAASFSFMKEKGGELVTKIEHDHWFAFRDPDGNLLMVCRA
jgi:hypothetical protein